MFFFLFSLNINLRYISFFKIFYSKFNVCLWKRFIVYFIFVSAKFTFALLKKPLLGGRTKCPNLANSHDSHVFALHPLNKDSIIHRAELDDKHYVNAVPGLGKLWVKLEGPLCDHSGGKAVWLPAIIIPGFNTPPRVSRDSVSNCRGRQWGEGPFMPTCGHKLCSISWLLIENTGMDRRKMCFWRRKYFRIFLYRIQKSAYFTRG